MKNKQTPITHDGIFKRFLTEIEGAKDFIDLYLPENIKSLCDFSPLTLINSLFIDKQLRSRISDVLYSVQTTKGKGYIYVLIEHQSTADKLMAWRLMHNSENDVFDITHNVYRIKVDKKALSRKDCARRITSNRKNCVWHATY